MIVLKKKYEELQEKYNELERKHIQLQDLNFKFQQIADGEYGSSIDLLILKWGDLMWKCGIKPESGKPAIILIERDLHNLLEKFVQRPKK